MNGVTFYYMRDVIYKRPLNVVGTNSMQQMLDKILMELSHLKTLYIFVCPSQKLSLKSNSLEKLCIYKSGNILHIIIFKNILVFSILNIEYDKKKLP